MKSEIPFREYSGHLKRHRLDENETLAALIVDLAFPHFRGRDSLNLQRSRIYDRFYGPGGRELLPAHPPRRRFSGDSFSSEPLSRGKYFSLSKEKERSTPNSPIQLYDYGVVQNELLAYTNYRASGPIMILDMQDEMDRSILENFGHPSGQNPRWDAFTVIFFRKPGAESLIDVIMRESKVDPEFDWDKWGGAITIIRMRANPFSFLSNDAEIVDMAQCFNLHYRFEEVRLRNVVDLRYPDTQEAFVRTFCPKLLNAHPQIGPIGGFCEMLPALLSAELGGTVETDMIGSYLRACGADALIFPSARYNGWVRFRGDELADFNGWNLVDYRGAKRDEPPKLPPNIATDGGRRIQIEIPPVSPDCGYGSWKIRGAMDASKNSFENEARRYFQKPTL